MSKNQNRYIIPGVYNELEVRIVSRRTIRNKIEKAAKGDVYNGLYLNTDHLIYIAKELHGSAKVGTLLHEVHHSVIDSVLDLDEERVCDVVGAFYYRLYNDPAWLACIDELSRG